MDAATEVVASVETPHDKNDDLSASKPALTPPTSEEDLDKRERMSSELTDLESDDDEEIEPDHYFDGGKIPVFKPTMDQFRSFKKFVDKIDKYGMKSGIVKVIPPKEWRDSLPQLDEAVKTIKVKNPIMQEFAGQHGIYTQANIEKQRSYNLPEWRALTEEPHHQPPARRGERRRGAQDTAPRARTTRSQALAKTSIVDDPPESRRGPGRPRKRPTRRGEAIKDEAEADQEDDSFEVPPTPKSPGKEEDKKLSKRVKIEPGTQSNDSPTKPKGRQPRSITSRRKNNRTETADWINEAAFEDFNYRHPNLEEYSIERCKELEENYWKTINYGQPMYGADMPGSLFDDRTTSWNVAKLENILDILGTKVPGVNTAYLYLGMWKATFAWHLEDVDLYSINYIHFGAPKQWYSISQEDARRFEAAMKSIWPRDAKNCSQFLRHKTYLISPTQLEKQFNIKVNRLVHYEGEFVITYPYGYHSGYNVGYNCAESVNFANEAWLNYGRIAKKCECEADSVWVDVNEVERKLRGEPTPEYYEETDDDDDLDETQHDFPSPPPSVAGKSKSKAGRKRKRDTETKGGRGAKDAKPKKIRRVIKILPKEMPCVLCPNDVEFDDLLPTDNGLKAHRLCAEYTPETYISSQPKETVCNVANIDRARLELKCNFCRSKRGAVFQCSAKKCTRAFHATCAAAAGVQVDIGPMPTYDEEGTEYFYDGYDFRCRFHRPKKRHPKTVDGDTLERDKLVFNYAKSIKPKDVVQFQFLGTDQVHGGIVVENRPSEWTVQVDVLPDGDRVEIEWKYLLSLDPEESQRPKPSPNAKPLPDHLKDNDPSLNITNRTDGVPEMGDPFQDPNSVQKWAEFNTAPEVTQKMAKVAMEKENQLWFYLGKTSTEARPQYTEDVAKPRHNTKSNFLDTVKEAPRPIPPAVRRSYPASYPIKPAVPAMPPRPSGHAQIRPAERPYEYKPKVAQAPAVAPRPSIYSYQPSDTWKNPHSTVAHQPNVAYDYRQIAPQYGSQSSSHSFHPLQANNSHFNQSHHSGWKPPSTSSTLMPGISTYARASQPPGHYSYYQTAAPSVPRSVHPPYPRYPQAQHPPQPLPTPTSQAHSSPRSGPPVASIMTSSSGPSRSPMYANATPSSSISLSPQSAQPQSSYIAPTGGFTQEWMPRPPTSSRPSSSNRPAQATLGTGFHNGAAPLPPMRPSPQFQSEDAFKQDVAKHDSAKTQLPGMNRWNYMIKHIAHQPPSQGPQHSVPNGVRQAPPPLNQTPERPKELTSTPNQNAQQPKAGAPVEPQRPIPSPLTDPSNSPQRPEHSPISNDQDTSKQGLPLFPQNTSGETWRYT